MNFQTASLFSTLLHFCFVLFLSLFIYFERVQVRKALARDMQVYLYQIGQCSIGFRIWKPENKGRGLESQTANGKSIHT